MKGRFVTLFAAALVSMTSAGACGGAPASKTEGTGGAAQGREEGAREGAGGTTAGRRGGQEGTEIGGAGRVIRRRPIRCSALRIDAKRERLVVGEVR